ncbi:MAG: hypothetical protein DHS20C05_17480 [Hyphococcus sp.]|nr:MAG: hypothetical protein DHS20C05_17480 [Marinicaulis sp.]
MASESQLLDPKLRNPELRAFAYLSARFSRGARTSVECITPLVIEACRQQAGNQYVIDDITTFISNTYKLELPYFLVDEMRSELVKIGAIKKDNTIQAYICHDAQLPPGQSSEGLGFNVEDIDVVEKSLSRFAQKKAILKPISTKSWGESLIRFFQSDAKQHKTNVANVKGALVANPASIENQIIAEFIQSEFEKKTPIYDLIEKIFYGTLVAEFFVRVESTGNKAEYAGLKIFYDTTVLLRLMGTSGDALRIATLEMHQILQDLGCETYYFSHTLTELNSIIDAIAKQLDNTAYIHHETRNALIKGEVTRAKILTLAQSPDTELGKLGVFGFEGAFNRPQDDKHQVDELAFQKRLSATNLNVYQVGLAAQYDAESLSQTVRLRGGTRTNDVSKCKSLFVTHNSTLVNLARDFLLTEGQLNTRSIGPMFTVGQITTIAWIVNEIPFDPTRISKELIANCYHASLPGEGWDHTFWEMVKETQSDDAQELAQESMLIRTAREIAIRESFGSQTVLQRLDIATVLDKAKAQEEKVAAKVKAKGFNEGVNAKETEHQQKLEARAKRLGKEITKIISGFIFLSTTILAVTTLFLSAIFPESPTLRFAVAAFSSILAVISLNDVCKFKSLPGLRNFIEPQIVRFLRKFQNKLLG